MEMTMRCAGAATGYIDNEAGRAKAAVVHRAMQGLSRLRGAAGGACNCGGAKRGNARLLAEARALTGRSSEDLRGLTDAALIQIIADAAVERRALTHPVCPYGLSTPRAAASIDWSGKGEPGARAALLTAEEQRVYTHPPDAYRLNELNAAREAANSPSPAMRAAAGELPRDWSVTNPGDAYGLEALEAARLVASQQEVAA